MDERPGKKLIFVKFITVKGVRRYASQYGLTAFPIWVDA
jgi:hypothetical protein